MATGAIREHLSLALEVLEENVRRAQRGVMHGVSAQRREIFRADLPSTAKLMRQGPNDLAA